MSEISNKIDKIIAGDTDASMKLDMEINDAFTNSDQRIPDGSLWEIKVFTERAKDLCNSVVGFPIFTEVPCTRLVGKDVQEKIHTEANEKKFIFTFGGFTKEYIQNEEK